MTCRTRFRGIDSDFISEVAYQNFLKLPQLGVVLEPDGPLHVRCLIRRAHVTFPAAMAIEAPGHAERLVVPDLFHLVDSTVAAHTTHAPCNVDRVIEVGIIGQLVDANPWYGHAAGVRWRSGASFALVALMLPSFGPWQLMQTWDVGTLA